MSGNGRSRRTAPRERGGNGEDRRPIPAEVETEAGMYLVYEFERRAYALREAFTIGRDTSSDLVVLEPTVSRTHARVNAKEAAFFLENLGATGTKVNGVRVEEAHQLTYGDRVEIGTAVLTVRTNPLPLGVSLDRPRSGSLDAIAAKRPTIRHPLISERVVKRPREWGTWIAVAVALAVVIALFLRG